ncbi:MAG TPA: hypothetical protein ENH35_03360 [Candidatus Moranbacteria bacterium]|nr:hypothetical protein [Candidatus Moranbacteria bacterium]HDZ85555.1 hypothetical protein [Candidatus Moranbacteria bacterium]
MSALSQKDLYLGYTLEQRQLLKEAGITVPEKDTFIPGIHCKGKEPFGNSDACYGPGKCYGVNGILSLHPDIHNLPCGASLAQRGLMSADIDIRTDRMD